MGDGPEDRYESRRPPTDRVVPPRWTDIPPEPEKDIWYFPGAQGYFGVDIALAGEPDQSAEPSSLSLEVFLLLEAGQKAANQPDLRLEARTQDQLYLNGPAYGPNMPGPGE